MIGAISSALGITPSAAFTGLAGIAGSVLGGVADIFGQSKANESAVDIMNAQNAFSAEQFAKRYQVTVDDMKKAGLNPMLAYGQGGGSPPSAVGLAQQTNPYQRAGDYAQRALGAANTAMQNELLNAQTTESISRIGVNEAQAKNLGADTVLKILEAPNVSQRLKNLLQQELLDRALTTATNAQELATRQLVQIAKPEEAKSKTWWGFIVSPFLKDFAGVTSGASNLKFLLGK